MEKYIHIKIYTILMKHRWYLTEHSGVYSEDATQRRWEMPACARLSRSSWSLLSWLALFQPNRFPPFPDHQWVSLCPVVASYSELMVDLLERSQLLMPHPPTEKCGIGAEYGGTRKRRKICVCVKTLPWAWRGTASEGGLLAGGTGRMSVFARPGHATLRVRAKRPRSVSRLKKSSRPPSLPLLLFLNVLYRKQLVAVSHSRSPHN